MTMLLRCLGGLLAAGMVLLGAVVSDVPQAFAVADDDYRAEYAAIYAGNLNDQDVRYVAAFLDERGWTRHMLGSSLQNQVRWWSVTGEDPAHPGEYADDADLLYYSTHGASNEDAATTRQRTLVYVNGLVRDRLFADGGDAAGNPAITPSGWRVYGLQTPSRWDNDLEWVVLAACNQLEYWASEEDGAHEYGRALMGYPRRAHAIFGYHEWAPEAPLYRDGLYRDTKIALDFLELQSVATGYQSASAAWEIANEAWGIPHWSGLRHRSTRGETIWRPENGPNGTATFSDPSVWADPEIEFFYTSAVYTRDVL